MRLLLLLLLITLPITTSAKEIVNFTYVPESTALFQIQKGITGQEKMTGFCGLLYDYLKEKYELSKPIPIGYEDRYNRFNDAKEITDKLEYGIICAANTIRNDRRKTLQEIYNSDFSNSFYSSQMAILLKEEDKQKIQKNYTGSPLILGIIKKNTNKIDVTTEDIFKLLKDDGIKIEREEVSGRDDAVNILLDKDNKKINAYTSDQILLEDLLYTIPESNSGDFSKTLKANNYTIASSNDDFSRFSTEPYGVIVYNKENQIDNALLNDVNTWLASRDGLMAISSIDRNIEKKKKSYNDYISSKQNFMQKISNSDLNIDIPQYNIKIPTKLLVALILSSLILILIPFIIKNAMKKSRRSQKLIILIHKNMEDSERLRLRHMLKEDADFIEADSIDDIKNNTDFNEKTKSRLIKIFLDTFSESSAKGFADGLAGLLFAAIKRDD